MLEVVQIVPVAGRAQVVRGTLGTPEPDARDARLVAAVADDVRMLHADLCVVDHDQIVLLVVADAVVGPMARVPVHDDRFVWRVGRSGASYFTQRPDVSLAVIWYMQSYTNANKRTKPKLNIFIAGWLEVES